MHLGLFYIVPPKKDIWTFFVKFQAIMMRKSNASYYLVATENFEFSLEKTHLFCVVSASAIFQIIVVDSNKTEMAMNIENVFNFLSSIFKVGFI